MRTHSKENERLGKVVFLICIVLSIFAISFCRGQLSQSSTLSREKQGFNWITVSCVWESGEDTFYLATYNKPNHFDFKGVVVSISGANKTVKDMVMSVYFENGTSIFVGAIPGTYDHGNSWFELTEEERLKFKTLKIKKIELFNSYNGKTTVLENWSWQYFLIATKS